MRNLIFIALLLLAGCTAGPAGNLMTGEWKFTLGDNAEYADPAYAVSGWQTILPGTLWEQQGAADYDGYAWYRTSVFIPKSLRKDAERFGGLMLKLGKIDDADETFMNGALVGSTGTMPPDYDGKYDTPREYLIAADKVKWGEENIIAVRVYDHGGGGGIYSEPVELTSRGNPDFIEIEPSFTEADRIMKGPSDVEIPVTVKSDFDRKFKGTITLKITSDFGREIATMEQVISIDNKSSDTFRFMPGAIEPGFYKVTVTVSSPMANKSEKFNFGYEPEKIVSPANQQPDFKEFWNRAKKELTVVKPQYRLIKIDSLCTPGHNVFLVEMRSLGNALIRGWYQVPVKPGIYPAVMQVPGYSSTIFPDYINYGDDIIGFGLNIRGHGNSCDDVRPGFPGYILYGIEDKEKYIYRGAYMDCVRGIDFLFSRPEVDKSKVAVEGASQGGALTFATAALANDRVRVCAPQVPFLSDFEDYFRVAVWPGNEFVTYVEKEKKQTWDQVYTTLSYFDIKNLAPMITAPLIMGAGLVDEVCPPHINFAAYNNVTSEKKYIVYPEAGHGLPGDYYKEKMAFIRSHFGLNN